MAEPTKQVNGGYIVISPDDDRRSRTWPGPKRAGELEWKARYAPTSMTRSELLFLASVAHAYRHIFSISQREFLPSHAAIRAHLAAPGARGQADETEEQGHE